MYKLLITLFSIFLLTGCKITPTNYVPKNLNSEKPFESRIETYKNTKCCEDLNNLKLTSLTGSLSVSMEENESLIHIGGMQSPYHLIPLADNADTDYFSIKSFFLEHDFAFIPLVSVLDESFNIINQTSLSYMRYKHQTLVYDHSHFWKYFSINKQQSPTARYLLVHTAVSIDSIVEIDSDNYDGMQMTMIGNQPVVYQQHSKRFSVKPKAAPSGALIIEKLGLWSKPINNSIIQPL